MIIDGTCVVEGSLVQPELAVAPCTKEYSMYRPAAKSLPAVIAAALTLPLAQLSPPGW